MSTGPYAPHESHELIVQETMWLQGALCECMIYGVELALFLICLKLVIQQFNRHDYKRPAFLLILITVIFVLGTLAIYSDMAMTQLSFINNRDYPGGPSAYEVDMYSIPTNEVATVSWVIGNWLMDALLVWRCKIIFTGFSILPLWVVMLLPCGLLLASIVYLQMTWRSSPFADIHATVPYFATTLSLNIAVTLLIAIRLLYCYRSFTHILGRQHGFRYAKIVAILAESAALNATFSLIFLITLALHHPFSAFVDQCMTPIQSVASLLILYQAQSKTAQDDEHLTRLLPPASAEMLRCGDTPALHSEK